MTFANLSGGRDSSAMVVKWLESGEKLDYVLFCDTGFEFDEMYAYIAQLDSYLYKKFRINITWLDARGEILNGVFATNQSWRTRGAVSRDSTPSRQRLLHARSKNK